MHANEPEMADKWEKEEESVNLSEGNKFDDVYKDYGFEVEKKSGGLTYWAHYGSDISGHKNSYIRGELSGWTDGKKAAVGDDRGRQSFSNPKAMAKWFEKNFKMKKESVNEGKLDRIGSQLIKDLDKKYKNQKGTISTFNKIKKDLRKKMPRVSDRVAGSIANQYNDFLLDKDLNPKEKLRLMVLTLKGLGMNEFVSEAVDKTGIIKKQFPWAKGKMVDAIKMMIEMDADGLAGILKNMKKNPKAFKQFVKDVSKMRGMNESGLQYRMGVKRYGKEGMTKIQSAAGSGADLSLIHI